MISSLLTLALLSQPYTRSRVDDTKPDSQCLWWLEGTTITYHQNTDGNAETPGETEFAAFNRSIATWQAQLGQCGNLSFAEGARTSSRKVGYLNAADVAKAGTPNENIVLYRQTRCSVTVASTDACFKDDSCGNAHDCWQFAAAAIAITTTSYSPSSGRILDSDIELNAPSFIFTTVDAPVCVSPVFTTSCVATDVQNTTTHELGHLLGLGHYPSATSTMSPRADPGEMSKRVLDPGSKQFICDVYPQGQASKTCFTPVLTNDLGPAAGCTSAPGAGWALLGLVILVRRRA